MKTQPYSLGAIDVEYVFSATPFLMLLLMLVAVAIGGVWSRLAKRAGGVVIIEESTGWRVRLPRAWPIFWGLGTTCGLGFVAVFGAGFATNGKPPLWLELTATVTAYIGGLAAYLWQWRIVHSGEDDLVYLKGEKMLQLPLTFGRVQRVLLPLTEIQGVRVEAVMHRGRRGGVSYSYRPILLVAHVEGQVLADWSNEAKAEAFAEWLAKELGVGQWKR